MKVHLSSTTFKNNVCKSLISCILSCVTRPDRYWFMSNLSIPNCVSKTHATTILAESVRVGNQCVCLCVSGNTFSRRFKTHPVLQPDATGLPNNYFWYRNVKVDLSLPNISVPTALKCLYMHERNGKHDHSTIRKNVTASNDNLLESGWTYSIYSLAMAHKDLRLLSAHDSCHDKGTFWSLIRTKCHRSHS